ncbi:MAG TPA: phage tail protein I [Lysobacter sp.]|nr:phage tail protein I [Lysobacter sp.]
MNSLLPPNATPAERALERVMAEAIASVPVPLHKLWNADTCPVALLPWLADALSVDVWDAAWPEQAKRDAIRASFLVHRHKGTAGAVKRALAALGWATDVVEWFQESPPAPPYTFAIEARLDARGISAELYDELERIALETKNARSHLSRVSLIARLPNTFRFHGATVAAETVEVLPYALSELSAPTSVRVACAVVAHEIVTLLPLVHP